MMKIKKGVVGGLFVCPLWNTALNEEKKDSFEHKKHHCNTCHRVANALSQSKSECKPKSVCTCNRQRVISKPAK
jgi:hypothetical protein